MSSGGIHHAELSVFSLIALGGLLLLLWWLLPSNRHARTWTKIATRCNLIVRDRNWHGDTVEHVPPVKRYRKRPWGFEIDIKLIKGFHPEEIINIVPAIRTGFSAESVEAELVKTNVIRLFIVTRNQLDELPPLSQELKGGDGYDHGLGGYL